MIVVTMTKEKQQVAVSRPVGRPTKYDPAICEKVIEYGKRGKSKAWMCAELGIYPQMMAEWVAAHPEFGEAIARAVTLSQHWWEDAGQNGMFMGTQNFQASIWNRAMGARFPDDWREKSTLALETPDLSGMSKDDLLEIRRIAAERSKRISGGSGS
jgi:hypothetical protein